MSISSRLKWLEQQASEQGQRLRPCWRPVTIFEGVEPTAKQAANLAFNKSIPGNGVGFRSIIIVKQRPTRAHES
jgi:hypothetical protein